MVVPSIYDYAIIALVGCAAGAGFGAGRSQSRRLDRVRPAIVASFGLSAIPAGLFMLISVAGVTGFGSGDYPFIQWIFGGFSFWLAVFVIFGIPFVGGALIPRPEASPHPRS